MNVFFKIESVQGRIWHIEHGAKHGSGEPNKQDVWFDASNISSIVQGQSHNDRWAIIHMKSGEVHSFYIDEVGALTPLLSVWLGGELTEGKVKPTYAPPPNNVCRDCGGKLTGGKPKRCVNCGLLH